MTKEFTPEWLCDEWAKGDLIPRAEYDDAIAAAERRGMERAAVIVRAVIVRAVQRSSDLHTNSWILGFLRARKMCSAAIRAELEEVK